MDARQFFNLAVTLRSSHADYENKPSAYNKAMRNDLERQVDAEIARVEKIRQEQADNDQLKIL